MIPVFAFDRSEEVVPGYAVAVHRAEFTNAMAAEDVHTFGGKDLVLVDGRAQFAEVAILRAFEAEGWEGRWWETYGKPAMQPAFWREWKPEGPAAQVHLPIEVPWMNERLHAIAVANGNT